MLKLSNLKFCPKCNEIKGLIDFYRNKLRYDGVNSWCKKCDIMNKNKEKSRVKENLIKSNFLVWKGE